MASYNKFAKFYDAVMGDRSAEIKFVKKLISKYHPKARMVLDIACGTGTILKGLVEKHRVYGLDYSKDMLLIAKDKLPKTRLIHQNMKNFKLSERFDVVLCLFDSINHLSNFSEWEKVFLNVKTHLNQGGIFIFDINTESKLRNLVMSPAITKEFDKNYMIMDITKEEKGIFNWRIKVFEHQKDDIYKLYTEDIKERSYPIKKIGNALKNIYSKIEIIDCNQKQATEDTGRVYFVCKK